MLAHMDSWCRGVAGDFPAYRLAIGTIDLLGVRYT